MIPVTKPFLPDIEEYKSYLEKIWNSEHITNSGPLLKELEAKLRSYLQSKHLHMVSNGTIALQIAIEALELKGEIITTPFSYIATSSAIVWQGCIPVFADIEPDTLTIDPQKIREAITTKTSAILATHVYGNPCNIEAIEAIANEFNLKVIYDAAHSFGVQYKDKPLVSYGDISTLSFHATKLFQTVEGGAIISKDPLVADKVSLMRNFGHNGEGIFFGVGINGKNSELHAAMGLCNLPRIEEIIARRKKISELYDYLLLDDSATSVSRPLIRSETKYNYSYYPVLFKDEATLLDVKKQLNQSDIFPRRYFHPSLDKIEYLPKSNVPITDDISKRVLCLPLYHELQEDQINLICSIILKTLNL
jgi:dTDP-4-amino-4,6-dideoxygalactose transaminase